MRFFIRTWHFQAAAAATAALIDWDPQQEMAFPNHIGPAIHAA
jgi:hypothetical protein